MPSTTTPHYWRARAAAIACGGLVALLAACSATATGPSATVATSDTVVVDSVARLTGSNALVALVAEGDEVVAYVCDGDIALGERFRGTLEDGRGQLRSQNGALLTVALADGSATGTFTPAGGTAVAFTTSPVQGDAGLYTADGTTTAGAYTAGWVVLTDGSQTGTAAVRGTSNDKTGAPRLDLKRKPPRTRSPRPTAELPVEPPRGGGVVLGGSTQTLGNTLPAQEETRVPGPTAELPVEPPRGGGVVLGGSTQTLGNTLPAQEETRVPGPTAELPVEPPRGGGVVPGGSTQTLNNTPPGQDETRAGTSADIGCARCPKKPTVQAEQVVLPGVGQVQPTRVEPSTVGDPQVLADAPTG